MAPGYVIALALETAGVLGLLLALFVMRAERRARSAQLRGFLRSGSSGASSAVAAPRPTAGGRPPAVRVVDQPIAPGRGAGVAGSAARTALHRVLLPRTVDSVGSHSLSAG
jgi:hypothetical protein